MPITLSGKKCAPNKVYGLNKQVSKYVVIVFFSSKISVVSLVPNYYRFVLLLWAFNIARPLLHLAVYMECCMVMKSQVMMSCKSCALLLWHSFLT